MCSYDSNLLRMLFCCFFFFPQPSADVQSARSAATRIPMSKGMKPCSKAVLGVSTVTRLESRAESQSMKIELRKSTICASASTAGGKNWGLEMYAAMATVQWLSLWPNLLPNISYRPHQYMNKWDSVCDVASYNGSAFHRDLLIFFL